MIGEMLNIFAKWSKDDRNKKIYIYNMMMMMKRKEKIKRKYYENNKKKKNKGLIIK